MSYRNIEVDGKNYEYVTGKTHTKVKGIGAVENEKIGVMTSIPEYCECCGEPMSELYSSHTDPKKLAVTPQAVRDYIRANAS